MPHEIDDSSFWTLRGVGTQECAPRRRSLGARWNPVCLQGLRDGRSPDAVIQLPEFALDVAVAPRRVVSGHANDQGSDRLHDPRSADTGVGLGPLGGDQPAVPAHDRVRCHGGGDSREHLASEGLAPRRESAALVVSQSEALSVELFLEHTILLEEILDDLCLVPGARCLVPGARCLVPGAWWRLARPENVARRNRSGKMLSVESRSPAQRASGVSYWLKGYGPIYGPHGWANRTSVRSRHSWVTRRRCRWTWRRGRLDSAIHEDCGGPFIPRSVSGRLRHP